MNNGMRLALLVLGFLFAYILGVVVTMLLYKSAVVQVLTSPGGVYRVELVRREIFDRNYSVLVNRVTAQ